MFGHDLRKKLWALQHDPSWRAPQQLYSEFEYTTSLIEYGVDGGEPVSDSEDYVTNFRTTATPQDYFTDASRFLVPKQFDNVLAYCSVSACFFDGRLTSS